MKKYIFILISFLFLLSSCGEDSSSPSKENTQTGITQKTPFYITTKTSGDLGNEVMFQKSAKLISTSELQLNSQASGKVSKIHFKVGDSVQSGDIMLTLDDTILNYHTAFERAKNALERAKINYDSTLLTLDKTISDLEIQYDKTKRSHDLLLQDNAIKLQKAKYDFETSQTTQDINLNKTSLDLEKLHKDLAKQKLDYATSITADENTLSAFGQNILTAKKSLEMSYFDITQYLDEILGVTDKNRSKNDSYEIYLGAKDSSLKNTSENQLKILLSKYESFKSKTYVFEKDSDYFYAISDLVAVSNELKDFLYTGQNMLKNSIASTQFPQSQIDGYYNVLNGYSQSIQGTYSSLSNLQTSIDSFLKTYLSSRQSKQEGLSILEQQIQITKQQLTLGDIGTQSSFEGSKTLYERTKIDLENSFLSSEVALKTTKNNLDNAIKNKEITLKSLKNAISDAEIALSEAGKNVSKLTVRAPIAGVISQVNVDLGQEVSNGTPLFQMVGDKKTKVELYLSKDQRDRVFVGDSVKISYAHTELSGKVESISSVAKSDFTYLTIIEILDQVETIGDFVEVSFLSHSDKMLLPVSIIKTTGDNIGTVGVFSSGTVVQKEIQLGQIFGSEVEVVSGLSPLDEVIMTDMKNYNENDFELVKR